MAMPFKAFAWACAWPRFTCNGRGLRFSKLTRLPPQEADLLQPQATAAS